MWWSPSPSSHASCLCAMAWRRSGGPIEVRGLLGVVQGVCSHCPGARVPVGASRGLGEGSCMHVVSREGWRRDLLEPWDLAPYLSRCCCLPSIQPAGPVLPCHCLLHTCAPHRQTATSRHHQKPPQVLLHGQWHECRHDAWPLLLAGQRRWGWRQQRQQSQEVQVHPPPTEPTAELLAEQLQDILAGRCSSRMREDAPLGHWALLCGHKHRVPGGTCARATLLPHI